MQIKPNVKCRTLTAHFLDFVYLFLETLDNQAFFNIIYAFYEISMKWTW